MRIESFEKETEVEYVMVMPSVVYSRSSASIQRLKRGHGDAYEEERRAVVCDEDVPDMLSSTYGNN